MALTKTPIELSSTPGIVDNSNATAITIDSSENVGIGVSPLTLSGNAAPGLTVSSNGPFILLQDANNADKVRYISNNTGELQFGIVDDDGATGKTEHMRLDSTGNLLLGTSSVIGGAGGSGAQIFLKQAAVSNGISSVANSNNNYVRMLHTGTTGKVETTYGTGGSYTPLAFFTNGSERMRIDTSGNVGIGVSSPQRSLVLGKGDSTGVQTQYTNSTTGAALGDGFTVGIDGSENAEFWNFENTNMLFATNAQEAFRITAARDMYFGQTSGSAASVGHIMQANGALYNTANGTTVQYLRRLNSDGDIVQFNRDGTAVGSIGVYSSDRLFIGAGDTNITFKPSHDIFYPSTATGAARDNAIDLGDAGARFKDIYLSGGVNFSANANAGARTSELLDDYEEGTWTPTIFAVGGGTVTGITVGEAYYTKVGRNVNIYTYISAINLAQLTTGTYICLGGLPFTCNGYSDFNFTYMRGGTNIRGGYAQSSSTYIYLCDGNGYEVQQGSNDTVTHLIGSCAYMTNS